MNELPPSDSADVNMNKLGVGVVSDTAAVKLERGVSQLSEVCSMHANINGHSLHV